jgi:NADH:ubiquinone oxidoreductase subunit B-like Fe-S oxidoreductase
MYEKIRVELYAGDHIGGFDAEVVIVDGLPVDILVNGEPITGPAMLEAINPLNPD